MTGSHALPAIRLLSNVYLLPSVFEKYSNGNQFPKSISIFRCQSSFSTSILRISNYRLLLTKSRLNFQEKKYLIDRKIFSKNQNTNIQQTSLIQTLSNNFKPYDETNVPVQITIYQFAYCVMQNYD